MRFQDYIEKEKPGLKRFYKWKTQDEFDRYLKDPVARGLAMTEQLMDNGCPREIAAGLSLLALYDLVIFIGTICTCFNDIYSCVSRVLVVLC